MNPRLPVLILLAASAGLTGCLTTTPKPTPVVLSPAETPEYKNALNRLVRIPDKHPLLDEGLVPLPALELVIAYQEAVKKNRYRDLAPLIHPSVTPASQSELEDDLLRREASAAPQLAILTDLARRRKNDGNTFYEFDFTLIDRGRVPKRATLGVKVAPDGTAAITAW